MTAMQEPISGLVEECGDTASEETHQFSGGQAPSEGSDSWLFAGKNCPAGG